MEPRQVKFYVYLKGNVAEIRRQRLEVQILQSWTEMCQIMGKLVKVDFPGFCIEYIDNEGDRVIVSTAAEWDECVRLYLSEHVAGAGKTEEPLRLYLRKVDKRSSATSTSTSSNRHHKELHRERGESSTNGDSRASAPEENARENSLDIVPSHFYVSGFGFNLPSAPELEEIQESVVLLLQNILPPDWNLADKTQLQNSSAALPEWLRPAIKLVCGSGGACNADLDLSTLERCLNSHALETMNENPAEAANLLFVSSKISPSHVKTYNRACCLALQGEKAGALSLLQEAVKQGYRDFEHMFQDPDLSSIRVELIREFQAQIKGDFQELENPDEPLDIPVVTVKSETNPQVSSQPVVSSQAPVSLSTSTQEMTSPFETKVSFPTETKEKSQEQQLLQQQQQLSSTTTTSQQQQLSQQQQGDVVAKVMVTAQSALGVADTKIKELTTQMAGATNSFVETIPTMAASVRNMWLTQLQRGTVATTQRGYSSVVTSSLPTTLVTSTTTSTTSSATTKDVSIPSTPVVTTTSCTAAPTTPIKSPLTPPTPTPAFPYLKELQRLEEMGFTNTDRNRQLLMDARGSVNSVIDRLLHHLF